MSRLSDSAVGLLKQLVDKKTSVIVSHDDLFYLWGTIDLVDKRDMMSLVDAGMMIDRGDNRYVVTRCGREYISNGEQL